jgi:anti-sigma factor RsiW
MSCPRAAEIMSLALEEETTPDERQKLQAHLDSCAFCSAEWRALQAVEGLLSQAQPVEPPARLALNVMQEVARQRQRQARWQRLRSLLYLLTGALALATAPILLIVSALEHNPSAARALAGIWGDLAAVMRALTGAIETLLRALVEGPCGPLMLAWVLLAVLASAGWLRLLAVARSTGTARTV